MTHDAETAYIRSIYSAVKSLCESGIPDQALGQAIRSLMATSAVNGEPPAQLLPIERELTYLKVRLADGTATNVSVPKALLVQAGACFGGVNVARKRIRDLAKAAPATVNNRSGWIQDQLTKAVSQAPAGQQSSLA